MQMCPNTLEALKKKICLCHYFFPASSPGLPCPPPPATPATRSAGSSRLEARKARLDCNATLSQSESGKADSALAWVWTKDAGKDAEAPAAGGQGCPVRAVRSARAQQNPMHNFPGRSSPLSGFPERCSVGVSWSRRSHLHAGSVFR